MDDLQNVPWDTIKLFDDTDDILDAWLDLFLQVIDKHVPIKHQRVKRINQPRWISPEILDAIKSRDRHKSSVPWGCGVPLDLDGCHEEDLKREVFFHIFPLCSCLNL